jgi:4-hydroxybenzoate polyprenyltransferase
LVVDLDGTLTPTDTLVESIVALVRQSPLNLLRLPSWVLKGRAAFKEATSARSAIAFDHLPYDETFLSYLREEKAKGREIILATAAHQSVAQGVSDHLGLFDRVIATHADKNLKGKAKLEAIREAVGEPFVYAGDSRADLPIWEASKAAVLVGASPSTAEAVRRDVPIEREFSRPRAGFGVWVRALRVHQWLKNLLLFVPLMTAFALLEPGKLIYTAIGFLGFSFMASATYIVNDLLDLENDRVHLRKRTRPFASGAMPIQHGLILAGASLTLGLALSLMVSPAFLGMLFVYLVMTSLYSWVLKEHVLMDVVMLALLYTVRILAGTVASGVPTSAWLLAFSVFIFLSLALVKRCAELVSLAQNQMEAPKGRDYRVGDLVVLWPLGIGTAVSAVVVFGLFISAPETQKSYATPELLWLVAIALIYWLARLWVKTSRGDMDDDPIVYAIMDFGSRVTVAAMIAVMLVAHFVDLPLPQFGYQP